MMVEMFKRAKFTLSVATKMRYDENFQFTENNIVSFLAELEEYICSLITYTAFKRDDINAAISAIPLERLINKDFNKKEIAVSLPYFLTNFKIDLPHSFPQPGIDIVDTQFLGQDGALPAEDTEITNGKQLY